MNHGVLASLNPEQVAVEIWRADELEVLRVLSSELDEMWSYPSSVTLSMAVVYSCLR